jgi:uncharacterized membrane protein
MRHFLAFVWLRWRLLANRLKRLGTANAVLLAVAAVGAVPLALGLGALGYAAGAFFLRGVAPAKLMYVWDVAVMVFLFMWMLGVLVELQRSEPVSLQKFLHLPVSLGSAFFLNYLSSLLSLALLLFLPASLGLIVGLVRTRGPMMLLSLPLLGALVYMITALTYHFQGWLASMIANPRRRRTVIVLVTVVFILVFQLPNLVNLTQSRDRGNQNDPLQNEERDEEAKLDSALASGQISEEEHSQERDNLHRRFATLRAQSQQQQVQRVEHAISLANLVLPIGWLPLGAKALAEGKALPALGGTLGLLLIGTASMWRAYRSTLRMYVGRAHTRPRAHAPVSRPEPEEAAPTGALATPVIKGNSLEKQLPFVSEHASAIAVAGFRSLLRAPEAKLLLITPVIMVIIFVGSTRSRSSEIPEMVRPLMAFGGMGMILLSLIQVIGNQFGFDRSGFRVFVLCPARRRDILLGKNLSVAPFALILALIVASAVEISAPMHWDYLLAMLPIFAAMYVVFCIFANWLSIFVPLPIAAGTLKPSNVTLVPGLLHVAFVFLFFPVMAILLSPIVAKLVLEQLGFGANIPICLLLSLVECAFILWLYRLVLRSQGRTLQSREKRILQVVTKTGV